MFTTGLQSAQGVQVAGCQVFGEACRLGLQNWPFGTAKRPIPQPRMAYFAAPEGTRRSKCKHISARGMPLPASRPRRDAPSGPGPMPSAAVAASSPLGAGGGAYQPAWGRAKIVLFFRNYLKNGMAGPLAGAFLLPFRHKHLILHLLKCKKVYEQESVDTAHRGDSSVAGRRGLPRRGPR